MIKSFIREAKVRENISSGVISLDSIKWCSFEISHELDRCGIPFDYQDVTHPSICIIDGGINGYECWLALTPYPQSLPTSGEPYENTSIFFANKDSLGYFPTSFRSISKNPIIYKDDAKYNSDPDIFFDDIDSTFYVVTRKRHGKDYLTRIVLQSSKDGQRWSDPITLFDTSSECLCPCVLKDEHGRYKIVSFNADKSNTANIEIWESKSLSNPSFHLVGFFPWNQKANIWHGDLIRYKGFYYMIFCGPKSTHKTIFGKNDPYFYLWLAQSTDGYNYTVFEKPLLKAIGVYRSTIDVDNHGNYCLYVSFHKRFIKRDHTHPAGNIIGLLQGNFSELLNLMK